MKSFLKDLKKVPVLRILVPFGFGIVLEAEGMISDVSPGSPGGRMAEDVAWCGYLVLIFLLILIMMLIRKPGRFRWYLAGESVFLVVILILSGIFWSSLKSGGPGSWSPEGDTVFLSGTVRATPQEKERSLVFSFQPELWYTDTLFSMPDQTLMVYLPKEGVTETIEAGDRWLIGGRLSRIRNRGNPGEFDYAAYMAARDIYYNVFAIPDMFTRLGETKDRSWLFWPQRAATRISEGWDKDTGSFALLRAICLGDKSYLPSDTRQEFADAGAMHLLAVSGLHIGMIWWMLNMIIRIPMHYRAGRIIKALLVLSVLWFYACITGLSSSVTRSVSMFTIVTITGAMRRSPNIYNTVFFSALLMLLIDPEKIGDAGFQLSYAAVLGIISFYPLLQKAFRIQNKLARRAAELTMVSISAQLATLPLTLSYFGQFPVWFVLTNLVSIPLVSLLMACFVIFSPMLLTGWQAGIVNELLRLIAEILQSAVAWISGLPGAVIYVGDMPGRLVLFLYMLLFFLLLLGIYRRIVYLNLAMLSMSLVVITGIPKQKSADPDQLIVYNFPEASVIRFTRGMQTIDFTCGDAQGVSQYTQKYLENSVRNLGGSQIREAVDLWSLPEDTMAVAGVIRIDSELWLIQLNSRMIALCGATQPPLLKALSERVALTELVFREGSSQGVGRNTFLPHQAAAITDGTVGYYEGQQLDRRIKNLVDLKETGAYIIDIQKNTGIND